MNATLNQSANVVNNVENFQEVMLSAIKRVKYLLACEADIQRKQMLHGNQDTFSPEFDQAREIIRKTEELASCLNSKNPDPMHFHWTMSRSAEVLKAINE